MRARLLLIAALAFPLSAAAADFKVEIVEGKFVVDGRRVPPGCLQRLMTELSGDDVTRSVFLTRSSVRGCIDANDPGREVAYDVDVGQGKDGIYEVDVCERVDGTMGGDCQTLIVQFTVRPYLVDEKIKKVLSLDKLGERVQTASPVGLANPASVNCADAGGRLVTETRPDGGEYGVCLFEDNRQCEEWALFRGECPAGGVKVTGYATEAGRFCAIRGGTYRVTEAAPERGTCTLPSGTVCDADAYYAGACRDRPKP